MSKPPERCVGFTFFTVSLRRPFNRNRFELEGVFR